MKFQILLSVKIEINISILSSAKLVHSVVKVNYLQSSEMLDEIRANSAALTLASDICASNKTENIMAYFIDIDSVSASPPLQTER